MELRRIFGLLAFLAIVTAFSSGAQAAQYQFAGPHPIAKRHGGGFCHIEFPHIHNYIPDRANLLYQEEEEGYFFVGDPVAHGYEGHRHAYHGAHPIHVETAVIGIQATTPRVRWCYLKGPHYHAVAPPTRASFEVKGDVYWYVGAYPPEFEAARPMAVKINAVYEPVHYHRPVVVVSPPTAYVDVFVSAPVIVAPHPPLFVGGPPGVIVGHPPGPPPPFIGRPRHHRGGPPGPHFKGHPGKRPRRGPGMGPPPPRGPGRPFGKAHGRAKGGGFKGPRGKR